MKHIITWILLLPLHSFAAGPCNMGPLVSTNKTLHLLGSAAIVVTVSKATDDISVGIIAAVAVGTARELYKSRCEYSSILYDIAGIYVGSKLSKHITIRNNMIIWSTDF
jgi:hypothetical protein